MAGAAHRVRQFFGALRPHVTADERADAYAYLNEAQRGIFESMMLRDQQHGIEVFRRIRAASPTDDPPLFVAALLHDCGKGRVALWQRVAHVLLGVVAPGVRHRVASEHGAQWRQAMWRLLHHPEIGAAMVARTDADPDTIRMIREQDAAAPDERLALLQAADDA
jgi:hypothetical protein